MECRKQRTRSNQEAIKKQSREREREMRKTRQGIHGMYANAVFGTLAFAAVVSVIGAVGVFSVPMEAIKEIETEIQTEIQTTTTTATATGFQMQGVAYVSWQSWEYESSQSTGAIDAMQQHGVTWATVLATWYQQDARSTQIRADGSRTPTDAGVERVVRELRQRGIKALVKPHVDCYSDEWRGGLQPSDPSAWFASYTTFITHYARLAQRVGADMLSIGCELKTMTMPQYTAQWQQVVAAVRQHYSGPLTYAANAVSRGDEFEHVGFWAALDYAGLDVYAPLTNSRSPSVDQLKAAWSSNREGVNVVQLFSDFYSRVRKPVIFTEIGYQSADGTNITPWDVPNPRTLDLQEQADCFEAAIQVWKPHASWMKGLFFWGWETFVPSSTDTHFNPRNKPAGSTMMKHFK